MADTRSHVDTFLELVTDANNNNNQSVIDALDRDISGDFDSVVIGLVCLHPCSKLNCGNR